MSSVSVKSTGRGPGLVVIPGGTRRAHHYDKMAAALADRFSVHMIDRRGRGASPPQDRDYSLDVEVADAIEVLDETGSEQVFGHSYGGLIGLHVALQRDLDRLMLYEPAVNLNSSFDFGWLDAYGKLFEQGRKATAYALFLTRMEFLPRMPIATPLMWTLLRVNRDIRAMLPTIEPELRQIAALDSDGSRYAGVTSPTLLISGGKSPAYLKDILPTLAAIMPQAKAISIPECDHNGPDLSGPSKVAAAIRA
jgi:pimeloyl-ACP methyl ester carboxylesterase